MKTVNELSKITGLSKRTIRYYDQTNLLKPEVVRITGLEPARAKSHMDLNHTRIPIPPYPPVI